MRLSILAIFYKGIFMKIRFNSIQKLAAVTFLFSLAGLLGACAPTTDLLGGAAGLDTQTATTVAATTAPIEETPPPSPTPIPPSLGQIIFVSNRDGQMSLYRSTTDGTETVS